MRYIVNYLDGPSEHWNTEFHSVNMLAKDKEEAADLARSEYSAYEVLSIIEDE